MNRFRTLIFINICFFLAAGVFCHTALWEKAVFASPAESGIVEFKNPFIPALPEKPKPEPSAATSAAGTKTEITPPTFAIQGLIWNSYRPQAIVNSQVVGIGDTVSDSRVLDIQKTGIEIIYQGKTFIVDYQTQIARPKENTPDLTEPGEEFDEKKPL